MSALLGESAMGDDRLRGDDSVARALHVQRAVIEQSVQATCICDPDGRVLAVNEAMAEILGLRADVAWPHSVLDDPQLNSHELRPYLRKALGGTAVITPPLRYGPAPAADFDERSCCWMQAYLSPLRGAHGRVRAGGTRRASAVDSRRPLQKRLLTRRIPPSAA